MKAVQVASWSCYKILSIRPRVRFCEGNDDEQITASALKGICALLRNTPAQMERGEKVGEVRKFVLNLSIRKCANCYTTGLVLENSGEGTWRKRKTEMLDWEVGFYAENSVCCGDDRVGGGHSESVLEKVCIERVQRINQLERVREKPVVRRRWYSKVR